jgi:hypothetical protein
MSEGSELYHLILNDQGVTHANLVLFRTFRHPLFPKPVSCPGFFYAASYSKVALKYIFAT